MTTEQAYNDFLNQLEQLYEKREADTIAGWIFENVTGLSKLVRRADKNIELDEQAARQIKEHLAELLQHKPVQYVLHEAWFYKMRFFVNEQVLIPRPETEELVGWVLEDVRREVEDVRRAMYGIRCNELQLLDIGTGSGCIAVSLKKELPGSHVTALDTSGEALTVASKNAETLQVMIDFQKIDFLDESRWDFLGMYDVIVSNPPYIPGIEKEKLPRNVVAFEPGIALFVPDVNPFIFYKKIAKFAQSHLNPQGKIFVEIHEDYSREVAEIFNGYSFKTEVKEDIYGKKRMIKAV